MVEVISHISKIQELGNKMVDNLEAQGVSASFEDGGMTLAEKILDIKPFTTVISLSATPTVVPTGISTTIKVEGTLKAQYSDSYINMNTPIKNQEILLKHNEENQALQTNTNGNFSENINSQSLSLGTHTFQADFDGVSFYPACESSSVTVTVRKHYTDIVPTKVTGSEFIFRVINTDTNENITSSTCTITATTQNEQSFQKNFTTTSTGTIVANLSNMEVPETSALIRTWTVAVSESNTYESIQKTFTV